MTKEDFYKKKELGELTWEHCPSAERTVNPNDIIVDKTEILKTRTSGFTMDVQKRIIWTMCRPVKQTTPNP